MKKEIKQSMKKLLMARLEEFSHEPKQDKVTIECYANNFVVEFERYLRAYNDFKED